MNTRNKALLRNQITFVCLIVLMLLGTPAAFYAQQTPAATSPVVHAQSHAVDRVFQSKALARPATYRVLLPAGYDQGSQRYPVLYLLHGWNGDYKNWETYTKLDTYAKDLPIIIVMVDAANSWYVDSATVPQDRFEQHILELVDDVDRNLRTLTTGRCRAIAGLSMGGYAAVKFGLKYPDRFQLAASMSGAFNATTGLENLRADLSESLIAAFGPTSGKTREENDVFNLVSRASAASSPYFYLACGSGDRWFIETNRKLVAALSSQGLNYEYHETAGAHTWDYWDQQLPGILQVTKRSLLDVN